VLATGYWTAVIACGVALGLFEQVIIEAVLGFALGAAVVCLPIKILNSIFRYRIFSTESDAFTASSTTDERNNEQDQEHEEENPGGLHCHPG
jgi:hypothetical protein